MVKNSSTNLPVDAEASPEAFSFGNFRIIPSARLLESNGKPKVLGSRAFDLLCLLVSRSGEVVGKTELMAKAWPGITVDESSLRFHITQLRRVLDDGQEEKTHISNVPGRGYCFVTPVTIGLKDKSRAIHNVEKSDSDVHNLPPRPERLIGRDIVIDGLLEHLKTRQFVTLRGHGGIGKTTVAVALAHRLVRSFRDGVRFIDFASLSDAQLVTATLASALGLIVPAGDPTVRLIEALRDREMFLIFDNCEHVVDAVAGLAEKIYRHAPAVTILATSRESLDAASEFVFELTPLDLPPQDLENTPTTAEYSSMRLFIECATAAGYIGPISKSDAETIAKICRKLDGVPLAIELVASRLSAHSLMEIDELIGGRLRLAWPGRRTSHQRHQSLSAALDWSFDLISPEERRLLEYFSVFPATFTLQGALALAGDLAEPNVILKLVEQLVAKSLVAGTSRVGQARFRLLETTRAYASEKLDAANATRIAKLRHANYVLAALRPRTYESSGARPGGWNFRSELLSDARAALDWAYSENGFADIRVPLAAVCTRLFVELELLEECRLWAKRAIGEVDDGLSYNGAKIELLWAFGHAAMFTERNSQKCEAALRKGLELAQAVGDLENQFRLLSRLHAFYRRTGERTRLLEVALLADNVAKKIKDPAAFARAYTYLGIAYHLNGDQKLAREKLEVGERSDAAIPTIPIDHFAYPRGTHIMSCTNLWLLGRPDQALEVANRLVQIHLNPDLAMHCAGLCFAARVYRWVGDLDALEEATDRLADHARKHGFGPFQNASVALRGELLIARGAVNEGVELLKTSLPRLLADRLELYSGAAAISLVEGMMAQARPMDALSSIQARIEAVTAQGDSWEMPELLRVRGEVRWKCGDAAGADEDLANAMALADRQSALSWKLRTGISRARLSAGARSIADSILELSQTYARFEEGFDTADLTTARGILDDFGDFAAQRD